LSDGPRFFTSTVNVAFVPAIAVAGPDFVTFRSALVSTELVSDALLFVLSVSKVVLVTDAVFVWLPVVELGTV